MKKRIEQFEEKEIDVFVIEADEKVIGKYTIAYHNKIKDYYFNFIIDIKADTKEEFVELYKGGSYGQYQ